MPTIPRYAYCAIQDNYYLVAQQQYSGITKIDWNCDREVAKGPCGHQVKQPP